LYCARYTVESVVESAVITGVAVTPVIRKSLVFGSTSALPLDFTPPIAS